MSYRSSQGCGFDFCLGLTYKISIYHSNDIFEYELQFDCDRGSQLERLAFQTK